ERSWIRLPVSIFTVFLAWVISVLLSAAPRVKLRAARIPCRISPERSIQMAESTASATWRGDLMSGSGQTRMASGAAGPLDVSWKRRTEGEGPGTSPEELIAAAHAACFAMALSHGLAQDGHAPTQLDTEAVVTFGPVRSGGFAITA